MEPSPVRKIARQIPPTPPRLLGKSCWNLLEYPRVCGQYDQATGGPCFLRILGRRTGRHRCNRHIAGPESHAGTFSVMTPSVPGSLSAEPTPGRGTVCVSIHLRAAGCHCEEPGDEAISHFAQSNQGDCFASLAMTNWWFSPSPARVNGYPSACLLSKSFNCILTLPAISTRID
jgi:hypothetical protein